MSYPVQTDQVKLGLERLITQWKDKPKIVGLLQSYLQSINELEETYFQLLTQRSISTAVGVQLDNLGLLVGENRSNRGDEEYRTAIKLRSAINASDGTEPKVVELLKILSGADTVFYEELYPAGIRITLEGPDTVVTNDLLEELKFILAATITAELSFVTYLDPPFVFENDDDGEGFADYGATSLFDLVTNNGDNIGLSTGALNILSVKNDNLVIDYDSLEGGYLAENVTITI